MFTNVQAVLFDAKGKTVLLKKFDLFSRKDRWRLVKGTREKGEKVEETLNREVLEEAGTNIIGKAKRIFSYSFVHPERGKARVLVFKAKIKGNPHLTRFASEEGIRAVKLVPAKKALKLLFWKDEKKSLKKSLE